VTKEVKTQMWLGSCCHIQNEVQEGDRLSRARVYTIKGLKGSGKM
jgi:hypothetical protein